MVQENSEVPTTNTDMRTELARLLGDISPTLWALMLLSLAVSVVLGYLLDIRFDEAFTLHTTANGPVYAFSQALRFEQQSPLYFVVLSLWRKIDVSIFFARLFSVLCAPFIVLASAAAARRYVKEIEPNIVAAAVALNPHVIWGALEIRLYALMILLSVLLLVLFYDAYLTQKQKLRARALYILVAVLALYTQYYLGFQLVAGAVALLVLRRWRALWLYVLDMAVAGLLFAPMLFVIWSQLSEVRGQYSIAISFSDMARTIYQNIARLFISTDWIPFTWLKRWGLRIAELFILVLGVWKTIRARAAEHLALCIIVLVLVPFFCVTIFFVGGQLLQHRHMFGLLLPLILLPFSSLTIIKNRKVILGWLALTLFLNVASLYVTYRPLAKPGDFRNVAQHIMAHEKTGQPILVFHADAALPLAFYYTGPNKLVPVPQANKFETYNPNDSVLKDEAQFFELIDKLPGEPKQFWLVTDGWCAHGSLSFNCELLEKIVERHFAVESSQDFLPPMKVRLLSRKPENSRQEAERQE